MSLVQISSATKTQVTCTREETHGVKDVDAKRKEKKENQEVEMVTGPVRARFRPGSVLKATLSEQTSGSNPLNVTFGSKKHRKGRIQKKNK